MALFERDRGQKESYARNQPLLAGETITGGEFRCPACGFELEKPLGRVMNLPVCARCQNDTWERR